MNTKAVYEDNLRIHEAGHYRARSGEKVVVGYGQSMLYNPTAIRSYTPSNSGDEVPKSEWPKIDVVANTTGNAGRELAAMTGERVAILNFASAKNPGGGYKRGTRAQEEDLCRCSLLYHALKEQPEFYEANRKGGTLLYTDHIIYTPRVTFFRFDGTYRLLEPYDVQHLDVITAPAPNAGAATETPSQIAEALRRRAGGVLAVAAGTGTRNIVLGAWGCGVFRNDPEMVADAFGQWLEGPAFRGCFDRVVFAIYAASLPGQVNLEVFSKRFTR